MAELWLVDLSKYASVKAFADKWHADGGRLDVLVLNAGLNVMKYEPMEKDRWESSCVASYRTGWETEQTNSVFVNNVATPLVALRLLPSMARTARDYSTRPRLVVVSSDVHYFVKLDKRAVASPNILQTLASEEFCKSKCVLVRLERVYMLNAS